MAVMPIRRLGDPVLRDPARPVERFDDALVRLSEDMFETMRDAPGVGLAAPQVGISSRFFVYDDGEGNVGALANPELLHPEGELFEEEGCLSIPGLFFPNRRASRVTIRGQAPDGSTVEIESEGLLARIFQHETDHLEGALYIDRLEGEQRRDAMRAIREIELGVSGGRPGGDPGHPGV